MQALEHRCILGTRVDATSYPDATAQAVLDARAKFPTSHWPISTIR